MSLKDALNNLIRNNRGEPVWLPEIEKFCKANSYKLSNAERRLRRSESPNVEPIFNDKHTAIIGYRWRKESVDFSHVGMLKQEPKKEEKVEQGAMFESVKPKFRYD